MIELEELCKRVDQRIERQSTGHAARRRQSQGLMMQQADLAAKYEACIEELDHCKRRIESLTRENAGLVGLVEKFLQIVDYTESDFIANWSFGDNNMAEADVCDGGEPVVGSEVAMETSAEEMKQTTEPKEAPVNELVSSINDDPDLFQVARARAPLDPLLGHETLSHITWSRQP